MVKNTVWRRLLPVLLASCLLLQGVLVQGAAAATVVELVNKGRLQRLLTDGRMARFGMADEEYVIMDLRSGTMTRVTRVDGAFRKQAIGSRRQTGGKTPAIFLQPEGRGKTIAGHVADRYLWGTGKRQCGVVYASKDLLKSAAVKSLFEGVRRLLRQQAADMAGYLGMLDDCTRAQMNLGDIYLRAGIPLRIEKRDGSVLTEVTMIDEQATLPETVFSLNGGTDTAVSPGPVTDRERARRVRQRIEALQSSGVLPPGLLDSLE